MSGDAQLMLMIAGMHLLGLVCAAVLIIPALRDSPEFPPQRPDGGSDGGGGGGPERPPAPPTARGAGSRCRTPRRRACDCAITAGSREHLPRRERRPAREPERTPVRT